MDQTAATRRPLPRKELLVGLLALLPFYGFFGFLFMGKRSERRRYTWFGLVYGGLNLLSLLLFLLVMFTAARDVFVNRYADLSMRAVSFLLYGDLPYIPYGSQVRYTLAGLANANRILYIACLVHSLASLPAYLRYMRDAVLPHRREHPLLASRRWRLGHELWLLWAPVPILGGGALVYAGRKLGNRPLRLGGLVMILLSLLYWMLPKLGYLAAALRGENLVYTSHFLFEHPIFTLSDFLIYFLVPLCLLLALYYRRDVLDVLAPQWETDCRAFPHYEGLGWRLRHSLWQLLSLLPAVCGIGLLRGGILGRKRTLRVQGLLMLGLTILWAAIYYLIGRIAVNDDALSPMGYYYRNYQGVFRTGMILLGLGSFLISCCWRRDVLVAKAAELGEYASDLDRAIARRNAIYDLWESRGTAARTDTAAEPEESGEESPAPNAAGRAEQIAQTLIARPETEPAAPVGREEPLDLNSCSRDELASLPGVGIAGAMRAMEYREERGGFASVDEFVDQLGLKPHFAVQVFELATVSPVRQTTKKPAAARRRIDL